MMEYTILIQMFVAPIIMCFVYITMQTAKSVIRDERFDKIIPLVAVILGSAFGCVLYLFYPEMIVARNIVEALIIGAISGWASTGANQTYKQLKGKKDD